MCLGLFLAAYTAVNDRQQAKVQSLHFLAAYTAVNLSASRDIQHVDFLAAYTAVNDLERRAFVRQLS